MDRPDEKQPPTSTSPETRAPALPSVVTAGQTAPNLRSGQSGTSVSVERSLPLHSLRNEIRVWTRDLLIAIGLALVIIVFLYQPVKVEGTSMAPLLSDQERIFINNRLSSALSVCRVKPWKSARAFSTLTEKLCMSLTFHRSTRI